MRTLIEDLARALDTRAHMTALERTKQVGCYFPWWSNMDGGADWATAEGCAVSLLCVVSRAVKNRSVGPRRRPAIAPKRQDGYF